MSEKESFSLISNMAAFTQERETTIFLVIYMQILVEIIAVTKHHFNIILQSLGLHQSPVLTPNINHLKYEEKHALVCSLLPEPSFPHLSSNLYHTFKHRNHIWSFL